MHRLTPVLRISVIALLLLVGFIVLQSSTPTASAYPSALKNFSAPTALTDTCVFSQKCHNPGPHGFCSGFNDPDHGCSAGGTLGCVDCFI
jgi:hypothetical protein